MASPDFYKDYPETQPKARPFKRFLEWLGVKRPEEEVTKPVDSQPLE